MKLTRRQRRRRLLVRRAAVLGTMVAIIMTSVVLISAALNAEPVKTEAEASSQASDTESAATAKPTIAIADTPPEASSEPQDMPYTYYDVPLSDELQEYTQDLCRAHKLQYEMVLALMSAETDYRANMISKTGDYGLMQINKINHDRLTKAIGITDYLDPYQNICAGVYMLSEIAEKYSTPQEILMVYNCGHAGARRLWAQGIYETRYTNRVIERMKNLKER